MTAQSIFWREIELRALLDAYRTRIEWDLLVPDAMRNAFDEKGKVKPKDMIKTFSSIPNGNLGDQIKLIKLGYDERSKTLDAKYQAPASETADKKRQREKRLKDAKSKNDQEAADALVQLMLDRFDPKDILEKAGLRPDGIPVDMALFGRMIASRSIRMNNVEGSSQFAHAISTNEFTREFDLWTRVDDRRDKRLDFYDALGTGEKLESGTDGMGDAEFTSACFYSYFNVDFCALVDNLTGKALERNLDDSKDREKAKRRACNAVIGLVKAAIFERPTGKFNSMATPSLPTLVLVEIHDSHVPVSYSDAFATPVDPKNDCEEKQPDTGQVLRVDLPEESARRLIREANRITKAFCREATVRLLFTGGRHLGVPLDPLEKDRDFLVDTVNDLVEKLKAALECPQERKDA
jgi:CRISPR system Cascade subunit CasC